MKDGTPTEELQNIIKLYVDDVREVPDSTWNLEKTFHGAICFLENHNVHTVSLDHDLGCFYGTREMTGRDILNWLIARIYEGKHTPTVVKVHSANIAASPTMEADIVRYFK